MTASKSVFLLGGDEEFLKEEWLLEQKQKFLKENESSADVDFSQFYADETDISSVLAVAKTKPFFAKNRLVVLKKLESTSLGDSETQELLHYLNSPPPDTTLVLETGLTERDVSRDKALSAVTKLSHTIFFKKLYGTNLSTWIAKRFIVRKRKMAPQVPETLMHLKGNNLSEIDKEIEKLSLYAADKGIISKEDVEKVVGRDIDNNLYDLLDAISLADKKAALELSLGFGKNELGSAVGLFCWHLRQCLQIKKCLQERWPSEKIESALGLNSFRAAKLTALARRMQTGWLKKALSEFTRFDFKVKTAGTRDITPDWQMLIAGLLARF